MHVFHATWEIINRGKRCTTATKAHVFTSSKKSVLCLRLYVKEKYS